MNQVHSAITSFFLPDHLLIDTIMNYPNIHIIYAKNELVSPISKHILHKIKSKIEYVPGKHVAFADPHHMKNFYTVLTGILQKTE